MKHLRRVAVDILTGPAGRASAFAVDIAILGGAYWIGRLSGRPRREPWDGDEE
jgi:hypothetical protein